MSPPPSWLVALPLVLAIGCSTDVGSAPGSVSADVDAGAGGAPTCGRTHPLYLNHIGATLSPGPDDAVANTSSLVAAKVTIGGTRVDQATWDSVVACVRTKFAPFDVDVVDRDPGPVDQQEIVIGGDSLAVTGRAALAGRFHSQCGGAARPLGLVFTAQYGKTIDPAAVCEEIAYVAGGGYGLTSVISGCPDIMNWKTCGGARSFVDADLSCGTEAPASCLCGGTTMNSYQTLAANLGVCPE